MGVRQLREPDPLLAGFFTVRDAARLLQMENSRRIGGWLSGWPGSKSGPVINRDFDGRSISFLDLMEIRFIEHFRKQGVTMPTIRRAASQLRKELSVQHPLALANSDKYLTDRRRIFGQAAEAEGDKKTWDLATNQYVMWAAIEALVARGVEFDPVSELAKVWRPMENDFPNVIVDPRLAFGRPVIGQRPTPTGTLLKQWKAGGGDTAKVARWFRIGEDDVDQAVGFELSLAA